MKKTFFILTIVSLFFTIGCKKDPNPGSDNNGNNSGGNGESNDTYYTVTFNANGGSGSMQTQTFKKGVSQALNANTFSYENHVFTGWNTSANGNGTVYTNKQEITISENKVLYAQWRLNSTINGHEWVDLGLPSGLLWATCNIGASSPQQSGQYFAWGETHQKSFYDWRSYKYAAGDYNELTKYCSNANYGHNGFTDNLTCLLPEDDAATANWGNNWRMPTIKEFVELKDNCSWTKTTQNGVSGFLMTASNGNSIFFARSWHTYGWYFI